VGEFAAASVDLGRGGNLERPHRASTRTNDVEARKVRRKLGWAGGPRAMNC